MAGDSPPPTPKVGPIRHVIFFRRNRSPRSHHRNGWHRATQSHEQDHRRSACLCMRACVCVCVCVCVYIYTYANMSRAIYVIALGVSAASVWRAFSFKGAIYGHRQLSTFPASSLPRSVGLPNLEASHAIQPLAVRRRGVQRCVLRLLFSSSSSALRSDLLYAASCSVQTALSAPLRVHLCGDQYSSSLIPCSSRPIPTPHFQPLTP
jgi:hypothetical protein